MLIAFFLLPAPPAPDDRPNLPVNVNYVYGMSDDKPQEWMPPAAWFAVMMTGPPLLFFLPTHLLLNALMGPTGYLWRRRRFGETILAANPQVSTDHAKARLDAVE